MENMRDRRNVADVDAFTWHNKLIQGSISSGVQTQLLTFQERSCKSSFAFLLVAEALSCAGLEAPEGDIIELVDGLVYIYTFMLHPRNSDSQTYPTSHL